MFFREPATNCDLGLITDPARKHGCYSAFWRCSWDFSWRSMPNEIPKI